MSFDKINFDEKFDIILCMEVLEHLNNIDMLINKVKELLNPKGIFIGSTINKTMSSFLLAIFLAENILNIVPKKTHSWKKFIKPNNLKKRLILSDFEDSIFKELFLIH